MTWFAVDDSFHGHPKLAELEAGPCFAQAISVWTLAGSWSAYHLTDGFVPAAQLRKLVPFNAAKAASELVRVGLWDEAQGGFRFRDWSHYQPTKDEVEEKRSKGAARTRKSRALAKERVTNTAGNAPRNAVTHAERSLSETLPRPDPSPALFESTHGNAGPGPEPQDTGWLVRLAFGRCYEQAHAVPWPYGQAKREEVHAIATWVDRVAERDGLAAKVVVDRLIRNWSADPWVEKNRRPWKHFAKHFADHWQPAKATPTNANEPEHGEVVSW